MSDSGSVNTRKKEKDKKKRKFVNGVWDEPMTANGVMDKVAPKSPIGVADKAKSPDKVADKAKSPNGAAVKPNSVNGVVVEKPKIAKKPRLTIRVADKPKSTNGIVDKSISIDGVSDRPHLVNGFGDKPRSVSASVDKPIAVNGFFSVDTTAAKPSKHMNGSSRKLSTNGTQPLPACNTAINHDPSLLPDECVTLPARFRPVTRQQLEENNGNIMHFRCDQTSSRSGLKENGCSDTVDVTDSCSSSSMDPRESYSDYNSSSSDNSVRHDISTAILWLQQQLVRSNLTVR